MTVLDSSAVVDYLIGGDVFAPVERVLESEGEASAPDVLVVEVLAALRREAGRSLPARRVSTAAAELPQLSLNLFESMRLAARAWELRHNFRIDDAMFVALAETLEEPLATKDRPLAAAAARHTSIEVLLLTDGTV